jgi:hypothetical protein
MYCAPTSDGFVGGRIGGGSGKDLNDENKSE